MSHDAGRPEELRYPSDFTEMGGSSAPLGARIQVMSGMTFQLLLTLHPHPWERTSRMAILRPVSRGAHSHLMAAFHFSM